MNTDPVTRFRAHIDALAVPAAAPLPLEALPQATRRQPRWLVPVTAAIAVLAVLSLSLIRMNSGAQPAVPTESKVTLPQRMSGYSYLTGSVSSSPPGRSILLYQQGLNVELADFPQALVLGAHSDVYRRVDLAEDRASSKEQGDPAPMLLSPDGLTVAVGSHDGDGNLALLDLATSRVETIAVPGGESVRPLSWSGDGRYIAAIELSSPDAHQTRAGRLIIIDLQQRTAAAVPGLEPVAEAAFSPDGTELAVVGTSLRVIARDGQARRALAPPLDCRWATVTGPGQKGYVCSLAQDVAWSPDGGLLAVVVSNLSAPHGPGAYSVHFVDAHGGNGTIPAPVETGRLVAGWTAASRLLILHGNMDVTTTVTQYLPGYWLEHDVRTGTTGRRVDFDAGAYGNYMLGSAHFASKLLLDMQIREPGEPERGPWPMWMQIVLSTFVAGAMVSVWLAVRLIRRRKANPV